MRSDRGRLYDNVEPVLAGLSADPLELNKGDGSGEPFFRPCLRTAQMDSAEPPEALAGTLLDARGHPLEVAIMRQEDAVGILRDLGDNWVGRVRRENVAQARNRVAASL